MTEIKRMDIAEFRQEGYLQEVNRLFFHPLGLALEVKIGKDGESLGGLWDYRDDPEGVIYGEGVLESAKTERIQQLTTERMTARTSALGYWVQPAHHSPNEETT